MDTLRNTGVVGAGVMGAGVAQALAQAGYAVILVDVSQAALDKAKAEIRRGVRFYHMLKPGGQPQNLDDVLRRITFSTDLAALGPAEFVIENVTEDWAVKQ